MKVNELRIGNYVTHDDYSSEVFKVTSIEKKDEIYVIYTEGGKNGEWVNDIELVNPIPLSKYNLKKAGFIEDRNGNLYIEFNKNSWLETRGKKLFLFDHHDFELSEEIKYMHQLQNIYFSLMGKEINIKLR